MNIWSDEKEKFVHVYQSYSAYWKQKYTPREIHQTKELGETNNVGVV